MKKTINKRKFKGEFGPAKPGMRYGTFYTRFGSGGDPFSLAETVKKTPVWIDKDYNIISVANPDISDAGIIAPPGAAYFLFIEFDWEQVKESLYE